MNIKLKVLMNGVIMLTLISGCVEETQNNDKSINISTSTPFFPRQKENPASYMDAKLAGELVLKDGCLRVGDDLIVWPYGFSVSTENEVTRVIDNNGQPIIRVGDKIELGGGEMPDESIAQYSAELPSDRCSGPYWIVGEVLTTVKSKGIGIPDDATREINLSSRKTIVANRVNQTPIKIRGKIITSEELNSSDKLIIRCCVR